MTARDIQRAIIRDRYRRSFCMPNYTPAGWWECDIMEVTKAGFFWEYEIKLSVSDFKADANKEKTCLVAAQAHEGEKDMLGYTTGSMWQRKVENKHQCIGQPKGPVCFYYVTPMALLKPSVIPAWAGLIEVMPLTHGRFHHYSVVKPAPRLHTTKINPSIINHARSVAYWRFQNLFLKVA